MCWLRPQLQPLSHTSQLAQRSVSSTHRHPVLGLPPHSRKASGGTLEHETSDKAVMATCDVALAENVLVWSPLLLMCRSHCALSFTADVLLRHGHVHSLHQQMLNSYAPAVAAACSPLKA